ncbi:MAG: hypothetical protein KDA75_11675, partial [Planctomycetaceae bacterium]|nr:hypothetical protein [Planctomycetaceae bacterium]
QQALDVYQRLPTDSFSTAQQRWIQYQQATCLRRLGSEADAERIYRRLVADADSDWLAEVCRWWLQHLDARRRLQANAQRLDQILSALDLESAHVLSDAK